MSGGQPIIVVGPMPPPVHGFSRMNQAVRDAFVGRGADVTTLNLSPGQLGRGGGFVRGRLGTLLRGLGGMVSAIAKRTRPNFYMGLSGGAGQWIDLIFIALARIGCSHLALHHHSFAYLDRSSLSAQLALGLAGPHATHVVLCERMGDLLRARYGSRLETLVISNAAIMAVTAKVSVPPTGPIKLGYLSNVSLEKGVDSFVTIVQRVRKLVPEVRGVIAGPYQDDEARAYVESVVGPGGGIEYRGPVYGEQKDGFFAEMSAFVFPSRYVNEAEPLVIHEALAAGLPIVSTCRGCIPSLVPNEAGELITDEANLDGAVARINEWLVNFGSQQAASRAARQHFEEMQAQHSASWEVLLDRFAPVAGPKPELLDGA